MSGYDPYWQANWGEHPIHPDMESLQNILDSGVIKGQPSVFATPLKDFPPGGRVITDIIGSERIGGVEIHNPHGWLTTTPPFPWAHIGDVFIEPHPTLEPFRDAFGRLIVPVIQG